MTLAEVSREAIRAHAETDRIAVALQKDVADFADAYYHGLLKAMRGASSAKEMRDRLLTYAATTRSDKRIITAIGSATFRSAIIGARSAAREVGGGVGKASAEDLATRINSYSVATARRIRLGILQQALVLIDGGSGDPASLFDAIEGDLKESWGSRAAPRVELVAETSAKSALAYGRDSVHRRAIQNPAAPYRLFSAVLDFRTSDTCAGCHKVVLPSGHAWWATHTPLLHFKCRSSIIGISAAQAKQIGITEEPPDVDAQEGFGKAADLCKLPRRPKHIHPDILDKSP